MQPAVLLLALGAVLACADPSEPPAVPEVTVSPRTQWSGGEVLLTSPDFVARSTPILLAGAETLAVRRLSDSVVAVVLPIGASGTITLDLLRGGARYTLGLVQRVGARGTHQVSPWLASELVTAWRGSTPVVLGVGPGSVLYAIDLGTMLVTPFPGVSAPMAYGVSPSYRPDEFLASDTAGRARRWRFPTASFVDTAPSFINTTVARQFVQLSDSVWLVLQSHSANVRRGSTWVFPDFVFQGGGVGLRAEGAWNVFLSPRGDLASYSVGTADPGVPVFRMSTGDTAYTLGSGFRSAKVVAFSSDGDRIFFLGGGSGGAADSLLVVRAASGEVLGGTHLPNGVGFGLAADPVQPLAYVEVMRSGHPTILVYDQNLVLQGELAGPVAGTPICGALCYKSLLVVDRARNQLHSVWANLDPSTGGTDNFIWTYDLLPTP